MKTLVLYCYREDNDTITNLSFFLKHGVIEHPDYHYAFIINNNACSIPIQETANIKVYKRTDDEYDLYTYKWYFQTIKPPYTFERYYFINSSCIGPFIPPIVEMNWIELFNIKLESYDLIAPIIEFPPDSVGYNLLDIDTTLNVPFLHSYMFGINKQSIHLFIDLLTHNEESTQQNAIYLERMLTSKYLLQSKKIYSFLLAFKNININDSNMWDYRLWNKNMVTCYEVPNNYFGIDVNPFEVIFVKNIRKSHTFRESSMAGISKYMYNMLKNFITWY